MSGQRGLFLVGNTHTEILNNTSQGKSHKYYSDISQMETAEEEFYNQLHGFAFGAVFKIVVAIHCSHAVKNKLGIPLFLMASMWKKENSQI
jgi:hypothetical protein